MAKVLFGTSCIIVVQTLKMLMLLRTQYNNFVSYYVLTLYNRVFKDFYL